MSLLVRGHRYSRRRLLYLGVAAPFTASLLAACGGSSAASGSSGSAATGATGSSSASKSASASGAPAGSSTAASSSAKASSATASSNAAQVASAPKPTPTPASGQTHQGVATTVDLWYGWAGANAIQTWKALGDKMATALPDFNVRWLTADNNAKLLTAIAGGTPPNVAVGNAPYPEFWARGAALPLDDLIAKSKVVTRKDVPDSSWSYASYRGKVYGVPAVEAFVRFALTLDTTNLQPLNIDAKTLSWDWDTLTQLQQELTKKASNGAIASIGIDPLDAMGGGFGGGNPFYWGQAWDIEYYDQNTGKFNFVNDQLIEGMTVVKKLYDLAGGAQAVAGFHSSYGLWTGNPTAMFPSGVEDLEINGYWNPGDLALTAPHRTFTYTWAPVPASKKGFKFQSTGGHNAFIPKDAKNTAEAFQVIEFLFGDTAEQTIFDNTGWLGARLSFLDKVDVGKYPGLDFYVQSSKQHDKLFGIPTNPIEGYTATQWNTAQQDVLFGKLQPKDALQQLQQAVTSQLQQQFPNGA